MKKIFLLCSLLLFLQTSNVFAIDIFVSTNGNDENTGGKNDPFLTIDRARLAVRDLIKKGLKENVQVYIMEGTYILNKTIIFGLDDSPKGNHTVTYQAYQNSKVIISSGQVVGKWAKAENVTGMQEVAKGHIWVADMPKNVDTFRTLFDGETRLTRARSDEFTMPVNKKVKRADSQNTFYNKDRIHLRRVPFSNNEIKDWDNLSDVEVVFNPVPWNLNLIQLESVDEKNKIGYLAFEANAMPFTNKKYSVAWIENVIDY